MDSTFAEPEYALAALRRQLASALDFAETCAQLAPELAAASEEVMRRDRDLLAAASAIVLRRS